LFKNRIKKQCFRKQKKEETAMKKENGALSQSKKAVYGFYKRIVNTLIKVPAPKELKLDSMKEKGFIVLYGDSSLMGEKMTFNKANRHKLIVNLTREEKKNDWRTMAANRKNGNGSSKRLLTQSEHQRQFFFQEVKCTKIIGAGWEIIDCGRTNLLGPVAPLKYA